MSTSNYINTAKTTPLEARIQEIGKELLSDALESVPSVFSLNSQERAAAERNMLFDLCMKNEDTARGIFQFMDVLPSLQTEEQILQHMREYLLDSRIELPAVIGAAVQLAKVAPSTAVSQIKKNA